MPAITIHNVPDAEHRALRARAALRGRSTEAEIRSTPEQAAKPEGRPKLGSLLASIARDAGGMTEAEAEHIEALCQRTPVEPMRFE
ncbi:plasmid stability protein stbC [Methylobacterium sp. WL64]|uniref:FitA-like ribbon-helix-helix domain-containing protein n=1 Tax=Methylobacterium sp. WL64 TaxID=2603894 RepID=UPI0011C80FDE|nr:plasmid stability protein stbC [Methylobacterium sp. WL64]TXN05885.1 plasmid stability protein stbC [Methylobacterium sp. WL64]